MRKLTVFGVLLALLVAVALPAGSVARAQDDSGTNQVGASPNIVEVAQNAGNFTTLLAAAEAAGLADTLATGGPFTVFAPTDAAFANALDLLGMSADDLLANEAFLTEILTYHVVSGEVTAAEVVELDKATTLQGSDINIALGPNGVTLNGTANVVLTDIFANNGVVHVIDSVLFPPDNIMGTISKNYYMSTLQAALEAANLDGALLGKGPYTLFVPTDDAFATLLATLDVTADELLADTALLTDVLRYHVVSGKLTAADVAELSSVKTLNGASINIEVRDGAVFLNDGVMVTQPDLIASNGVIHVIDGVLLPPQ